MRNARSGAIPQLFLCAAKDELAASVKRLHARRRWSRGGLRGVAGEIDQRPVVIAWSGEGPQLARRAVAALEEVPSRDPIVVLGVAGALHPEARVGDLIVAQRVRYGDRVFQGPKASVDAALGHPSVVAGDLVTVDRIVETDEQRVELWQGMQEPKFGCVDMESAAFVQAAQAQGRSVLVVRAVSDRRGDRLPGFLSRCRRRDGSIDRTRVVLSTMVRPWALPRLIQLQRHVSLCSGRLDDFAGWWLRRDREDKP